MFNRWNRVWKPVIDTNERFTTRNIGADVQVAFAFAALPYTKHRTNKFVFLNLISNPPKFTLHLLLSFRVERAVIFLFTDKHDVALSERRQCATQINVNTLKCSKLQGVVINYFVSYRLNFLAR